MIHTEPLRVIIRWRTADPKAIEAIRKKFNLPAYTTVNGLTPAEIKEEDKEVFEQCRERGFFTIIRQKWRKNGGHYTFNSRN